MFYQRVASLSVILAASLIVIPKTGSSKPAATHRRTMAFGGTAEVNDGLVLINGLVGPNEFFYSLHSVDSKDGQVFVDNHGEVRFFPDRLTIRIFLTGPVPTENNRRPMRLDKQFMAGLKFKADWKRAMDLRSVKELRQLTASETDATNFVGISFIQQEIWTYEFVIEDFEVPLGDHLIFYIMSPEGKPLARLSAYL